MAIVSELDLSTHPPVLRFPGTYNAAADFIDRHLQTGHADNVAVIDDQGSYTYGALAERVNRTGNLLAGSGLQPGDRIAMVLHDSIDFPAVFWGAMKAGFVPIPLNTMLATRDYAFILEDSAAAALVISAALLDKLEPVIQSTASLKQVIVAGRAAGNYPLLEELQPYASTVLVCTPATPTAIAFWLYSSGSTGQPKGVMHHHASLMQTAVCYGKGILGISGPDRCFSAAKLFFAYGLGNGMSFPFAVGACAILMAGRPTPAAVTEIMARHPPTLFFGVPSLYAAMLAEAGSLNCDGFAKLRACVSAGEALPEEIGKHSELLFGVPILDGIGSTEMLHIFLSNRPGDVRYGSSGKPVPGYHARLVDEQGGEAAVDEIGELVIEGPSAAVAYWNRPDKTQQVFRDGWTWTGDKYTRDAQGYYHYCGRADDMLKVSGQWVSPFEVESTLVLHPDIQEAAVVGDADENNLVKPRAFVVLKPGRVADASLRSAIQDFVKMRIAPHKYPRWIEFVDALPKTATGKIQRFRLRSSSP